MADFYLDRIVAAEAALVDEVQFSISKSCLSARRRRRRRTTTVWDALTHSSLIALSRGSSSSSTSVGSPVIYS